MSIEDETMTVPWYSICASRNVLDMGVNSAPYYVWGKELMATPECK